MCVVCRVAKIDPKLQWYGDYACCKPNETADARALMLEHMKDVYKEVSDGGGIKLIRAHFPIIHIRDVPVKEQFRKNCKKQAKVGWKFLVEFV